jgi:hypothetical protein
MGLRRRILVSIPGDPAPQTRSKPMPIRTDDPAAIPKPPPDPDDDDETHFI